jgi:CAAX protease family protein
MAQVLNVHWRGHAFLFEKKRLPTYSATGGLRLLLIFLVLEGVIGPRLALFSLLQLPLPPVWLRVPILLGLALLLVRFVAGLKLSEIGLYRWGEWSATEKSYFLQVVLIANVIFSVLFADRLRIILAEPFLLRRVGTVFLPYLLWGFYQEVMYRGILQTELVRRWGPLWGINKLRVSKAWRAFESHPLRHPFRSLISNSLQFWCLSRWQAREFERER